MSGQAFKGCEQKQAKNPSQHLLFWQEPELTLPPVLPTKSQYRETYTAYTCRTISHAKPPPLKLLSARTPRAPWQTTLGAVYSGAGRIPATILGSEALKGEGRKVGSKFKPSGFACLTNVRA